MHRKRGFRHGQVFVPLNDDVVEGKWVTLDPDEVTKDQSDSFLVIQRALLGVDEHRAEWREMLRIMNDEDGPQGWESSGLGP